MLIFRFHRPLVSLDDAIEQVVERCKAAGFIVPGDVARWVEERMAESYAYQGDGVTASVWHDRQSGLWRWRAVMEG